MHIMPDIQNHLQKVLQQLDNKTVISFLRGMLLCEIQWVNITYYFSVTTSPKKGANVTQIVGIRLNVTVLSLLVKIYQLYY